MAALREDSDPPFTELEVDREAMGDDFSTSPEIVDLQRQDPGLQEIISQLQKSADEKEAQQGSSRFSNFVVLDEVLYFMDSGRKGRLRIAVPESLREQLMGEAHAGKFSEHFAAKGLYENLACRYWWDGMYSDVHKHCRGCLTSYVVVFMDYLTKWVEAFAIPDQTTETIVRLLIDGVVCRHGFPQELL